MESKAVNFFVQSFVIEVVGIGQTREYHSGSKGSAQLVTVDMVIIKSTS